MTAGRTLAVVGGGWAGLAAAVRACELGWSVTLFEMAREPGGRARSVTVPGAGTFDNGQHILIGAYHETLDLMQRVGVDLEGALCRRRLELRYPDGDGLTVAGGPPVVGFALGVLSARGWSVADRVRFLRTAWGWWRGGMRNPGVATVAELCAALPTEVRSGLIEPLCVAAMNTPAERACATVFLRVMADALFGVPHGSDLLLPRRGLSALLPTAAASWLRANGAVVSLGHRVEAIHRVEGDWLVDDQRFGAVVLACSATEAARLALPLHARWSKQAADLPHEPIATVYLRRTGPALSLPMVALRSGPDNPAQFAFDLDTFGAGSSVLALVVSGAGRWLNDGLDALARRVAAQARRDMPAQFGDHPPEVLHASAERRATFVCTPALDRPPAEVGPRLYAAGDYVRGPYPATLEGAVRSGLSAATLACEAAR